MTDRKALAAEEEATLRAALGHFQDEPNGRLIGRLLATLDRERAAGVRLGYEGLRAAALGVYHGRIGFENPRDPDILALGVTLFPDRAARAEGDSR